MTYDEAVAQLEDLAAIIGRSSDAVAIRVVLAEVARLRVADALRPGTVKDVRQFVASVIEAAENDTASEGLGGNAVKEAWARGERTAASLILSFIDARTGAGRKG